MERNIYNIGSLRYILTITFGKNRQITKETIESKNEKGETISESHLNNYIIAVGKKAVIITEPNIQKPGLRRPLVIKPWKYVGGGKIGNNKRIKSFVDNEGHLWNYLKDNVGEMISYYNGTDHQEEKPSQFENGKTKFFHFEVHPGY